MLVVSSREFRANQGKYLSLAANGEDIVLKSRDNGCFKLTPITPDDTIMSREQLYARIEQAEKQIQEGKYVAKQDGETMEQFVERLICTE